MNSPVRACLPRPEPRHPANDAPLRGGPAQILACLVAVVAGGILGCAHASSEPGAGRLFAVSIESIDGRSVVTIGHMSQPSYVVQVGTRLVRVWLAKPAPDGPSEATPLMETDAQSLKSGILIERSWTHAVVHEVTEEELAAGAALIYVPGDRRSAAVELRFRRLGGGA